MKEILIQFAMKQFGEIFPCNGHSTFDTCFTLDKNSGELIFWFNLNSGSTNIVRESQLTNI